MTGIQVLKYQEGSPVAKMKTYHRQSKWKGGSTGQFSVDGTMPEEGHAAGSTLSYEAGNVGKSLITAFVSMGSAEPWTDFKVRDWHLLTDLTWKRVENSKRE